MLVIDCRAVVLDSEKMSSVASFRPRNVCTGFSSFMRYAAWSMYHGVHPTTEPFRNLVAFFSFFSMSVERRPWKGGSRTET